MDYVSSDAVSAASSSAAEAPTNRAARINKAVADTENPQTASLASRRTCALGIMAKAPSAGSVKTRLTPPLTAEQACQLSKCFLSDTANNIQGVLADSAHGIIVYTPPDQKNVFDRLAPKDFRFLAQTGDCLGARLLNATRDLLSGEYESVILINSDSPTLPPEILKTAIEILESPGDRLVLGPAEDGGYYLIGLKSPHEILFDGIAWSTSEVLAHTIERAKKISLEVVMLPSWYDVDDAETLDRLCSELLLPRDTGTSNGIYPAPHTREYLSNLLERERDTPVWTRR